MFQVKSFLRNCLAATLILGGASAATAATVNGSVTGPSTITVGETATFNYTLSVRPKVVYPWGLPSTIDYDSVVTQGMSFNFGNGQTQTASLSSTQQVNAPWGSYFVGPEHFITFTGSFQATFDSIGTFTAALTGRFNFRNVENVVVGRKCTWSSRWFGCLRWEDVYGQRDTTVDSVNFNFSAPQLNVVAAPSAVPLPAGALLLLSGLAGVAGLKRRKKATV